MNLRLSSTASGPRRRLARTDLDTWLPRAHAWATVLASPAWWRLPDDDHEAHRSGVELAYWTNHQVHRSGLCMSCWMRESEPDVFFCDGGRCRNFTQLLQLLAAPEATSYGFGCRFLWCGVAYGAAQGLPTGVPCWREGTPPAPRLPGPTSSRRHLIRCSGPSSA